MFLLPVVSKTKQNKTNVYKQVLHKFWAIFSFFVFSNTRGILFITHSGQIRPHFQPMSKKSHWWTGSEHSSLLFFPDVQFCASTPLTYLIIRYYDMILLFKYLKSTFPVFFIFLSLLLHVWLFGAPSCLCFALFKWCHSGRSHSWMDWSQRVTDVDVSLANVFYVYIFHICLWTHASECEVHFIPSWPLRCMSQCVCFWSNSETDVSILRTLIGHDSLLFRQRLSVTTCVSIFLFTSYLSLLPFLFIHLSLLPQLTHARRRAEASLNHSLTERGKEWGDGEKERDKGGR